MNTRNIVAAIIAVSGTTAIVILAWALTQG